MKNSNINANFKQAVDNGNITAFYNLIENNVKLTINDLKYAAKEAKKPKKKYSDIWKYDRSMIGSMIRSIIGRVNASTMMITNITIIMIMVIRYGYIY
jgi:hypothetical protein